MTNPDQSPSVPHDQSQGPTDATAPADSPLSESSPSTHAESPFEVEPAGAAAGAEPKKESKAKRKARERATQEQGKVKGSFAASTWIALIVGFLLLIVLIIFILQNQDAVPINFLNWTAELPAGIAYLICAIAGALIMALVGGWRMFELRRQVRRARKALQ